jgi:hypothetical protein
MAELNFTSRAKEFFEGRVLPWWRNIVCAWPPELRKHTTELLLGAILLSLRELTEAVNQGGNYFNITPFQLIANAPSTKVLGVEVQGRVRDVTIWLDSALGGPPVTMRIGTSDSGAGNGVRCTPGVANELGKVPPQTQLFASSDVTINGYIIERG